MSSQDVERGEDRDSQNPVDPETGDRLVAESVESEPVAEETPAAEETPVVENTAAGDQTQRHPRRRVGAALHGFFFPRKGSRFWRRAVPWAAVLAIIVGIVIGSAHGWAWSNSPEFCGKLCHTMPPQYVGYQVSAHSRVTCVECHIGREFIGKQLPRKTEHSQFIFRMAFGLYEYPIYAKGMRPARDACETCHAPDKFSNDSLQVIEHYKPDETNTPYSITLVMRTGGGTEREGLGRGIHWHIENKVQFLSTDELDQDIPYVRVTNTNGSVDEYVDIDSGLDTSSIDEGSLKTMDCITCHNRVSHTVAQPTDAVESSMSRGVISTDIPYIRTEAVKALTAGYASQDEAFAGIAGTLDTYYRNSYPAFYASDKYKIDTAIAEVQRIYSVSVFPDQLMDWNTHPDNVGHIDFPGCFRCHDGKHLNTADQAIRLECNICHSVPVVTGTEDLVTNIEVTHGPEPESHLNPNWIGLHNLAYLRDPSCDNCHTLADDGGTSNTSFCSNSACHGTVYKFAGFDAQALRETLKEQLPSTSTTVTTSPPVSGTPTYDAYVGALFSEKCGSCHGTNGSAGLDLTTYTGVMKGSSDGPVIVPGDSAASVLVQIQSGGHFANLTAQESEIVSKWIDAGAPES